MLIDYGLVAGGGLLLYLLLDKYNGDSKVKIKESETTLKIGYSGSFIKKPILVDMRLTPHLLVCGLSGQGKSRCIEYAMKGKDCVLLNAFSDDFKSLKCRRIITNAKILKYLQELLHEPYKREKPLYIVIDEMLVLCSDKNITTAIKDLLAVGRHYNIYLIGIAQRGTKQDLSFKDLFNARLTFKQVESSSYNAILGYNVADKQLNQREFYLASNNIYKGKTYDI